MLHRTRTAASPAEPRDAPLVRLDDRPQYSRLAAIRLTLLAARDERARQAEILAIQRQGSSGVPRSARTQERLQRLLATAPPPPAPPPPDPSGLAKSIAAGLRLVAGEAPEREPSREEKERRLQEELTVLGDALSHVDIAMDKVRADLSVEIAQQLRDRHREVLRQVFAAAQAFATAVDAERNLYAQPILLGYEALPHILNRPALASAARLGSAAEHDSELNQFRRRLEVLGVL